MAESRVGEKAAQHDRFINAARALRADEGAFKAKLSVIARQKPKDVVARLQKDDDA